MKNILLFILAISAALGTVAQTTEAQWTTIKNGRLWRDTNGNDVQAHGAGFLKVDDTWYMVGEDRSSGGVGVNLYSSKDLQTWTFRKKIIGRNSSPGLQNRSRFIERPKLMRCPSTGQFVVWCHYEQSNYGASEAASFYCDEVDGDYTFHWGGRPLGIKSRDCNVFVDNDGKAYFVATTDENQHLTLFTLSDNYLDAIEATRLTRFNGAQREAPAIVHIGDRYFLVSSLCTGWDPNQGTVSYSNSLKEGWSAQVNVGNNITFDTQAASILTIQGTQGTTYLYVGDRWQDPQLAESKTIIMPIEFNGTTCTLRYRQQFDIDFTTGLMRETPLNDRVPKDNWHIRDFSSEETTSENGRAINAIDGNPATKWHNKYSSPSSRAPHWIEVDMGAQYDLTGFLATPRSDGTSGLVRNFVLYVSENATDWKAVAGGGWLPYWSEVYFAPVRARYFRFVSIATGNACIAEIDMLQGTPAFTPRNMTPRYKINGGNWQNGNTINVMEGDSITLGAQISNASGTWAWGGADLFTSTVQNAGVSKIKYTQAGTYSALFLNHYGEVNKTDITVNVTPRYTMPTTEFNTDLLLFGHTVKIICNDSNGDALDSIRVDKRLAGSSIFRWLTSSTTVPTNGFYDLWADVTESAGSTYRVSYFYDGATTPYAVHEHSVDITIANAAATMLYGEVPIARNDTSTVLFSPVTMPALNLQADNIVPILGAPMRATIYGDKSSLYAPVITSTSGEDFTMRTVPYGSIYSYNKERLDALDFTATTSQPYILIDTANTRFNDSVAVESGVIRNVGDEWVKVTFKTAFAETPLVFPTVLTSNNFANVSAPVQARIRNVTATDFELRVAYEDEYVLLNKQNEDIAYFAIPTGAHSMTYQLGLTLGGSALKVLHIEAFSTANNIATTMRQTAFSAELPSVPLIIAALQSNNDEGYFTFVYSTPTKTSVRYQKARATTTGSVPNDHAAILALYTTDWIDAIETIADDANNSTFKQEGDYLYINSVGTVSFTIYTVDGRTVLQSEMSSSSAPLNISALLAGVYIVRTDKGTSFKFVRK